MTAVIAALAGAGVGAGVWLVVCGARGVRVLPNVDTTSWRRAGLAVAGGLVAAMATGWMVAAPIAALAAWWAPQLLASRSGRDDSIAKTEAIAGWSEMIRDAIAAASGLEEAVVATASIAPAPIRSAVGRLVQRLRHQPLAQSLVAFGDEVAHPSADLVVAALTITARMEANDVSALLSRLAEAARADARMRVRVEVGRARIRTATRVIVGVVAATALLLAVFNRGYLDAYDTAGGQVALVVVAAIFATSAALLARMARLEEPARFTARAAAR